MAASPNSRQSSQAQPRLEPDLLSPSKDVEDELPEGVQQDPRSQDADRDLPRAVKPGEPNRGEETAHPHKRKGPPRQEEIPDEAGGIRAVSGHLPRHEDLHPEVADLRQDQPCREPEDIDPEPGLAEPARHGRDQDQGEELASDLRGELEGDVDPHPSGQRQGTHPAIGGRAKVFVHKYPVPYLSLR